MLKIGNFSTQVSSHASQRAVHSGTVAAAARAFATSCPQTYPLDPKKGEWMWKHLSSYTPESTEAKRLMGEGRYDEALPIVSKLSSNLTPSQGEAYGIENPALPGHSCLVGENYDSLLIRSMMVHLTVMHGGRPKWSEEAIWLASVTDDWGGICRDVRGSLQKLS